MARQKKNERQAGSGKARSRSDHGWFAIGNDRELGALLIILGVAVVARVIYAMHLHDSLFYGSYISDAQVMHEWGQRIAAGVLGDGRPFFRAPLYGIFLGALYAIFGSSHLTVIIPQMLMGLGIAYLTFIYARKLFDSNVAIVAAAIASIYPTLLYFEAELLMTTLTVFLSLSSLILMHRALEEQSRKSLLIAGLVLGLTVITRPTFLLIAPLLPLALYLKDGRRLLKPALNKAIVFVVALLIPILPVTLYNVVGGDELVAVSSQFGANFYLGNSKTADGITIQQLGAGTSANYYYQDNIQSIDAARQQTGRQLSDSEVSAYWAGRAVDDILDDPLRAIGLYGKKLYLFWHGQEIFNVKSLYYAGEYSWLMGALMWRQLINFPSGLLFPLMLAGIFIAFRNRVVVFLPIGYLVVYTLVVSLFFVNARFRQPLIPVAIIFAAVALVYLVRYFKRGEVGRAVLPLGICGLFLIVLNLGGNVDSRENLSQYAVHMGTLEFSARDYPAAAKYFEEALDYVPGNARAFSKLAATYSEMRQFDKAMEVLGKGINAAPEYAPLWNNLGVVYAQMDNAPRAKVSFQKAIAIDPQFADAHFGLAQIYQFEGKLDSARVEYSETLRYNPDHAFARQMLQRLPN